MALSLQNKLSLQNTTDRFAKSTQHLISHLSKSFATKNKTDLNETELSDSEIAIRCQINLERLLYKTLELIQNTDGIIPNPHHPPLLLRVDQYYKSIESELKQLTQYENNGTVKNIKNVKFNLLPQYQSQLNIIKNWIFIQNQTKTEENNDENDFENDKKEIILNQNKKDKQQKKDWKLRKRRRIMRFSEKLKKENEEKRVRNMDNMNNMNNNNNMKMIDDEKINEREELIKDLQEMTDLLKKGVIGLRETLNADKKSVNNLDEETEGSLDKVSSLNNKLTKYVQSTSGANCTLCLMMTTVIITWIWGFFVIYFV